MLFAKTTPSFRKQIAESLPLEELEVIVEKKRKGSPGAGCQR